MAYGDDSGFAAWLATMGHTLPADAPDPAVLRARGSAYLDGTYEGSWTGQRAGGVMQADGWPRTGAKLGCTVAIADDVIPLAVVNASYRAAWLAASAPGALSPAPTAGPRVKRQKVDVIEREFFDDGKAEAGSAGGFIDPEIDGAMRAFICDGQPSGFFFASVGT
jgi:hypothetical protein